MPTDIVVVEIPQKEVIVIDTQNPSNIEVDTIDVHVYESPMIGIYGEAVLKSGEALAVGDLVYAGTDNKVYKYNASNPDLYGKQVGFAIMAASGADITIKVRFSGIVTRVGWALTPGTLYFAALAGAISVTHGRVVLPVGVALNSDQLMIQFGTSYIKRP